MYIPADSSDSRQFTNNEPYKENLHKRRRKQKTKNSIDKENKSRGEQKKGKRDKSSSQRPGQRAFKILVHWEPFEFGGEGDLIPEGWCYYKERVRPCPERWQR